MTTGNSTVDTLLGMLVIAIALGLIAQIWEWVKKAFGGAGSRPSRSQGGETSPPPQPKTLRRDPDNRGVVPQGSRPYWVNGAPFSYLAYAELETRLRIAQDPRTDTSLLGLMTEDPDSRVSTTALSNLNASQAKGKQRSMDGSRYLIIVEKADFEWKTSHVLEGLGSESKLVRHIFGIASRSADRRYAGLMVNAFIVAVHSGKEGIDHAVEAQRRRYSSLYALKSEEFTSLAEVEQFLQRNISVVEEK